MDFVKANSFEANIFASIPKKNVNSFFYSFEANIFASIPKKM